MEGVFLGEIGDVGTADAVAVSPRAAFAVDDRFTRMRNGSRASSCSARCYRAICYRAIAWRVPQ